MYVIDHSDGLVLFDTGRDRAVVTDPDYYADRITAFFLRHIFGHIRIGPEDTLPVQFGWAGCSATEVDKAVLSHLHSDPVGGIAVEPIGDPSFAPSADAFDLRGDGTLMVLPTPGHLLGSVSLLVRRTAAPPLLLVGDLTYDEQLLDLDQVPAVCNDPEQLLTRYVKVRELKRRTPDLIVLPAHDPYAVQKMGITAQVET